MIRNKLSEHTSDTQRLAAYLRDKNKKETVYAYKSDGSRVPLKDVRLKQIDFVGGFWRIQDDFPYRIENVRGLDFVIGEKLPHKERTLFDFYSAFRVGENCYGKYISGDTNYIVAKYVTVSGIYSAYGKTIEDARAYLGIKLYDQFQDVIHKAINTKKQK